MNNERRKQLKDWIARAKILKSQLEKIESDEEDSFESMPDGLKSTINGINSEEAIDKLNEAIECIEDAIDCVDEVV